MTGYKLDTNGHSLVGPSSIADVILCPGRSRLQVGMDDVTSFDAANGTVAHSLAEQKLNGKRYPKKGTIINEAGHDIIVDTEMIEAVDMYVNHIADLRAINKSSEEKIEGHVSIDHINIPEVYGTVDYSLSLPFQTLYVRDYKHGTGITVQAEHNEQLMAYAIGAAGEMLETYETINMGIVQPRAREGEKIKTWETTPDVLLKWAEDVLRPTVKLALSDDAPLTPGPKQCHWCRAKSICPALAQKALKSAQADFSDFSDFQPDPVDTLTIEQVEEIYPKLGLIKTFIKAIEERVFSTLSIGQPVKGYKLVNGRRSRNWTDEISAVRFLKALDIDPYEMKLLSPAKAEKLLDKDNRKEIEALIETTEGKPSIVRENDKREAITTASEDFKNFKKD